MEMTLNSVQDMSISTESAGDLFVYDIPYPNRKELCRVLDMDDNWKNLGGLHMNFAVNQLLDIESRARRSACSPTDLLLSEWGERNHKLLELFVLLVQYEHFPALQCIKDLVDSKYRQLIDRVEDKYTVKMSSPAKRIHSSISGRSTNSVPLPVKFIEQRNKEKSTKVLNGPEFETSDTSNVTNSMNVSTTPSEKIAESTGALMRIPYSELEAATDYWSSLNILGKGGFGVVYRGDWKHTAVAVKRLKNTVQGGGVSDDSLRELKYLNACRHDNVLPLYGYSVEGGESLLVYQLMTGGSLEERLKCRNGRPPILWKHRLRIAQGVAKGLQYLHTVSETPLIHGDIKSANILLDHCGEPRIGDFGLAREGPDMNATHLKVSRVHGTRPYLPDEFLRGNRLSTKVDAYSFGVVLFELVTALPVYQDKRKQKFLKDHVMEYCSENPKNLSGLQDNRLIEIGDSDPDLCQKFIIIGIKCVQTKAADRPDMVVVWQELRAIPGAEEIVKF